MCIVIAIKLLINYKGTDAEEVCAAKLQQPSPTEMRVSGGGIGGVEGGPPVSSTSKSNGATTSASATAAEVAAAAAAAASGTNSISKIQYKFLAINIFFYVSYS